MIMAVMRVANLQASLFSPPLSALPDWPEEFLAPFSALPSCGGFSGSSSSAFRRQIAANSILATGMAADWPSLRADTAEEEEEESHATAPCWTNRSSPSQFRGWHADLYTVFWVDCDARTILRWYPCPTMDWTMPFLQGRPLLSCSEPWRSPRG